MTSRESGSASDGPEPAEWTRGLAERIIRARREGRTLAAPQGMERFSLSEAYAVQDQVTASRVAAGERLVGWKLGYTSRAMREQMGVQAPNFGPLTDAMMLHDGARVPSTALQPRAEPEIAVRLGTSAAELSEPVPTREQVAAAVSRVHAVIEIVDSVWTGYRFRLEDNTADGSSAAWVVWGPELEVDPLATDRVSVRLTGGGGTPLFGLGSDAQGHPLDAVAWLAGQLRLRGRRLEPGDVVITGGLTRAVALDHPVRAEFDLPDGRRVSTSVLPPESGPGGASR